MVVEVGPPSLWVAGIDVEKTYYLAGPMKGYPDHNFPAFEEAAEELRDVGLKILSPRELVPPVEEGGPTWRGYLANDFKHMCAECQGIILLKGWPASQGARAELEIALTLRWPVYYYHNWTLTNMNANGVI